MEIGGYDFEIAYNGIDSSQALDMAARHVSAHWPDACVYAITKPRPAQPKPFREAYPGFSFKNMEEIFIFKDFDSMIRWSEYGAGKEHMGALVHLIKGETALTIVCDQERSISPETLKKEIEFLFFQVRGGQP